MPAGPPDSGEHVDEARVAGQRAAEHDRVRHRSDDSVGSRDQPGGDRRPHYDLVLTRPSHEQGHEYGQASHEWRGIVRATERDEIAGGLGRQLEGVHRTAGVPGHRAGTVGEQLTRCDSVEGLAPLGEPLLVRRRDAVREFPAGHVGELERHRSQVRRAVCDAGLVQLGQLAEQDVQRRAVAGDVMDRDDEDVAVRSPADNVDPPGGVRGQIERPLDQVRDRGPDFRGVRDRVPVHGDRTRWVDRSVRARGVRQIAGAQDRVPAREFGERGGETVGVQGAVQDGHAGHDVLRGLRFEPV